MYRWLPVYFCISLQGELDVCAAVEKRTSGGCRTNAWNTKLSAVLFDGCTNGAQFSDVYSATTDHTIFEPHLGQIGCLCVIKRL